MNVTYDDFLKKAKSDGQWDSFSEQDLALAKMHPEAGMSILSYKNDHRNATTAEEKALANEGANNIRKQYGNYTAGADGSGYYATSFYDREVDKTLDEMKNYSYNNNYSEMQKNQLDKILNREEFSYDPSTDPLYSSYKKTYLREGDRATQNTLAQASAMTGGIPSSYAVNAAAGAGNYYAGQLADVIPTLYDKAYNKYLQEYQNDIKNLGIINEMEGTDYQRFLDGLDIKQTYLNNVGNRENTEYTRELEKAATKEKADQQAFDNATKVAELYGYAPGKHADALGVDENIKTINGESTKIQDAISKAVTMGYLSEDVANILGYNPEELTVDQLSRMFDNAMDIFKTTGEVPAEYAEVLKLAAGTQSADWKFKMFDMATTGRMSDIETALSIWQTYGTATEYVANILGVPVGATTSDKDYNDRYLYLQGLKKGRTSYGDDGDYGDDGGDDDAGEGD